MRWFTSDTHFFHDNVIRLSKRPFSSIGEMHEFLISRWNKCVGRKDTVYHLGDVSWKQWNFTKEILDRLNGNKILIWGNHDRKLKDMLKAGFNDVYENLQIKIGDTSVVLSHFPYLPRPPGLISRLERWWSGYTTDQRYRWRRLSDEGLWLLHGHVHNAWRVNRKMINVGVDVWNYSPVSEEIIQGIILKG